MSIIYVECNGSLGPGRPCGSLVEVDLEVLASDVRRKAEEQGWTEPYIADIMIQHGRHSHIERIVMGELEDGFLDELSDPHRTVAIFGLYDDEH